MFRHKNKSFNRIICIFEGTLLILLHLGTQHHSKMIDIKDIVIKDRAPVYKQLVEHIEGLVISGKLAPGEGLPSMAQMAKILDVSKETVKKAYGVLTRRGLLESHQGKGFFVRTRRKTSNLRIIIITDNLSSHRKMFIDAFRKGLGPSAVVNIMIHNKDVQMLEYLLDQSLGKYDYFVITPHFSLDVQTSEEVKRQISRIPSRHLILADRILEGIHGEFGAAYQDFSQDVPEALSTAIDDLRRHPCLDVFTLPDSLYGEIVEFSIARFCDNNGLHASFHNEVSSSTIKKGQVCFIYDYADQALFFLNEKALAEGIEIGKDIKVIMYNDSPLSAILFGGLSTISTDFELMGSLCAEMIVSGEMKQIKCPCRLIRRRTF